MRTFTFAAATAAALSMAGLAQAGTYAPITIDGSFSDWDSVPVAATSGVDSTAPIDFTQLKIANDATNVYFLLTYGASTNPQGGSGVFTAIDSDSSGTTGDNIYGNAAIGSNFGFQNDFPFTQTATNFNSNGTSVNNTYAASPYGTATTMQEISIPLSLTEVDTSAGGYNGLVFGNGSFTVEFYTTEAELDFIGPVNYTLAAVPEPASLSLLTLGALPLLRRRRTHA